MSDKCVCDAASRDGLGAKDVATAGESTLTVVISGRSFTGNLKSVLDELAFEHYPVRVDAGGGERVFPSFDGAREYLQSVFTDAD